MIEEILPAGVESAELFHDPEDLGLFPEEHAQIARAIGKRQREYAGARRCARAAMGALGLDPVAIVKDEGGAPRWPRGIVGSMTHTEGYRAAALGFSMQVRSIGIDAEQHGPLPSDGVLESVSLPAEREWLDAVGGGEAEPGEAGVHWGRLLFSAKESTYKAWHPLTGRWLGFEDAHITFSLESEGDSPSGAFRSTLLVPGHTHTGDELAGFDGRWLVRGGLVVTAIVVI